MSKRMGALPKLRIETTEEMVRFQKNHNSDTKELTDAATVQPNESSQPEMESGNETEEQDITSSLEDEDWIDHSRPRSDTEDEEEDDPAPETEGSEIDQREWETPEMSSEVIMMGGTSTQLRSLTETGERVQSRIANTSRRYLRCTSKVRKAQNDSRFPQKNSYDNRYRKDGICSHGSTKFTRTW
jgi:hypothetical protein